MLENIKTEIVDGETWYHMSQVGKALQMGNIRSSLTKIPQRCVKLLKSTTPGGSRCCSYINTEGLKMLIIASRKPLAMELAKELGIDCINYKYESKESECVNAISKAFQGEKIILQKSVKTYKVDIYFPDYDLCIEIDENNHNDRDEDYEKKRQRVITKILKCKWLRFNPDSPDFNIFTVINQIFIIIKTCS